MKRRLFVCLVLLLICITPVACAEKEQRAEQNGYYFIFNGVCLTVGDDADAVVAKLGEPNLCSSAPSCAGEGEDELYVYNGFRIYAHRDENGCVISSIELINDTVGTPEGVRIGDEHRRVTQFYGEEKANKNTVEYTGERCRLRFLLRDGRVVGIKYLEIDG